MIKDIQSRPTRARGLKQVLVKIVGKAKRVAPHAGAWIETIIDIRGPWDYAGRAPRGRVD